MIKHLSIALLSVLALVGCGEKSTSIAGLYQLETEQFAGALADTFIEMGKAPKSARAALTAHLRSSVFDIEVFEDGKFVARQNVLNEKHVYRGRWSSEGTGFQLNQSHEDNIAKADAMSGTLVDGTMKLTLKEAGQEIGIVLHHVGAVAAPSK